VGAREAYLTEVIRAVDPDLVVFQEAIDPRVIANLAKATALTRWAAQPGNRATTARPGCGARKSLGASHRQG
jgi:hypothetical protein